MTPWFCRSQIRCNKVAAKHILIMPWVKALIPRTDPFIHTSVLRIISGPLPVKKRLWWWRRLFGSFKFWEIWVNLLKRKGSATTTNNRRQKKQNWVSQQWNKAPLIWLWESWQLHLYLLLTCSIFLATYSNLRVTEMIFFSFKKQSTGQIEMIDKDEA